MADEEVAAPAPEPPGGDREIRVPEPRIRRRTSLRSVLFSLFATLFGIVLAVSSVAIWGYGRVNAPGPLAVARKVIIKRGSANEEVAAMLERQGIVDNAREFLALVWLTRPHAPIIKAGEYRFEPHVSMLDALSLIRSGRTVTYKVTLPEGWTSARILERIREQPALSGDITRAAPEGSLLPDTFLYKRGTTRDDLIAEMQAARDKVLEQLWAKRAAGLPLKTPEEAVILASIVEKETGLAEERPRVAAVFLNRLKRHMRLQSDPTVIYGITGGKSRLDRPLTRADLAAKTPYNTYQIDGLPPTPIANPGRESLAAVLNPDTSNELYFVADGTGGHVFSSTLRQHRQNVKRWRQLERDQRDAEAQGTAADNAGQNGKAAAPAAGIGAGEPPQSADRPAAQPTASPPAAPAEAVKPAPAANEPAKATAQGAGKPAGDAAATPASQAPPSVTAIFEPGKLFKIAGRLVPIPQPRPPR